MKKHIRYKIMHHGIKRAIDSSVSTAIFILSISAVPAGYMEKPQLIQSGDVFVLFAKDGYKVKKPGYDFSEKIPLDTVIKFRAENFDPLLLHNISQSASMPIAENALEANQLKNPSEIRSYIVQFHTQVLPVYQTKIRSLGGKIYAALPGQAMIINMDSNTHNAVKTLPYVRWIGKYHPTYKISPEIMQRAATRSPAASKRYSLLVMTDGQGMQDKVAERIKALGGKVEVKNEGSRRMEFTADIITMQKIAQMSEVLWLEDGAGPIESDGFTTEELRSYNGANQLELLENYAGQGVRGEVCDHGLRTTHTEFQANLPLLHTDLLTDATHGTGVYSIVFASGVNPNARGLLPNAEQPIFSEGDDCTSSRTAELVDPNGPYRAVFQTRSWGNRLNYAYSSVSADMDDRLFRYDILTTQSQSNSGSTMSRPEAWAKNIVSVGGIRGNNTFTRSDDAWNIAGLSSASIGPAPDGRIKPDLNFFFDGWVSAAASGDEDYTTACCTSGATPAVAGSFGLLFQMWADGVFDGGPGKQQPPLSRNVFDSRPHMSTAKALIIHSAFQYPFSGQAHANTRIHQGWGQPNLKALYNIAKANNWSMPILIDETQVIEPLGTHNYSLISDDILPLKVTLVYTDPPGNPASAVHRVNDLTLKVTSPSGTIYWGNNGLQEGNWSTAGGTANTIDTVENVFIEYPEVGTWSIQVIASEIVTDAHVETPAIDADYALIASFAASANLGVNKAPTFTAAPIRQRDGEQWRYYKASIAGSAVDPEGDPLSYSKLSGPPWLNVASNGAISGLPTSFNVGLNVFLVQVSDGTLSETATLVINVRDINYPPTFNMDPVQPPDAVQWRYYKASIADSAVDPEGDPISFSKLSGPPWLNVASNGAISGLPTSFNVGSNVFQIQVSDTPLSKNTATLIINVRDINYPPTFNTDPVQPPDAVQWRYYRASIADSAVDPEGDALSYSKLSGPVWLNVDGYGAISGLPASSDVGSNVFQIQVSDGPLSNDTATLIINVLASSP